ncbi:hypothetical protein EK21DRAFT_93365 [Setomelanomma holmii]|uniref:Uncharacterized protein n=1 Tax=Setomelanomma holmii TaxID=210430 RepID=A0A9P4LIP7_9PLEO|nr:hypothetical protein EK21DRAFT_93365 [Setomelanomma holmii]
MATSTTGGSSSEPDMALIGELLEEISRNPPAIAAKKLLVEHYISVGWLDAATDTAKDLKALTPRDPEVLEFLQVLQKQPEPPVIEKASSATPSKPAVGPRVWDPKTGRYKKTTTTKPSKQPEEVSILEWNGDLESSRQELAQGYRALRSKAKYILSDLMHLQTLQEKAGSPASMNFAKIQALAEGRETRPSVTSGPPGSARSVARTIQDNPGEATVLATTDLVETMEWVRDPRGRPSNADDDAVRNVLVKRKDALQAALPDNLKIHCDLALMHIEHEYLERNYANTETMLGDEIKDVSRANFYVTEDNYAWDMEELASAITANNGIMRNPLSKEMFTPKDVKGILHHPMGKSLAALTVEQHEMSKGVRSETIARMEILSRTLLEDQTADTVPSRKAVDEFLVYIATLPELEQKAIEHLKCPARDSHTGQAYDFSIGEAVRDAQGNRVCFHKTGDFIKQAAVHLRQNRGVAPDPEKCNMM